MSKKRGKEKSVENKPSTGQAPKETPATQPVEQIKVEDNKKKPKWGMWIVLGVLVLIILLLVIFILLSKSTGLKTACELADMTCYKDSCPSGYEQTSPACKSGNVCCKKAPEKSLCEKYNNTCYNNSCPYATIKLDVACGKTGEVCCSNASTYETPCQKQGNFCLRSSLPEPSCPLGYNEVDLGCVFGEICCKKTLTPCETAGHTCKDVCTAIDEELKFTCNTGQKCCDYVIKDRNDCESEGYRCQYPSCNSGYSKVGICDDNTFCCQKDTTPKLVIHGFVTLKQGNCMPPTNATSCKENPIDAYVGIFPLVPQSNLQGPYLITTVIPIASERSVKNGVIGYYEIQVPAGEYSVFAQDPLGNKVYYCNDFEDGNACPVTVTNESVAFDITIDHATYW